jgi:very-short-patch-repair endonuclease
MNELDINDILDMYDKDASTYVIAEKYNTYPNKIRRLLIKYGRKLNDRSTAQKKALETGRIEHPTKGKKRSDSTKEKISESVYKKWQTMSDQDKQSRIDKAKEQWNNMSELERESLRKSAAEAVRKASKEGSKMENFLLDKLTMAGYDVIFHKTGLIPSENLEIDLFLPALNVAIEIDGPSHFLPIWGEENLQKHISADAHKSGLLLSSGFVIVRIKHLTKNLSEKHKRNVLEKLLIILQNISNKFPTKHKRYIELEVE